MRSAVWTPEELEAMRLADEEIEREFGERYAHDPDQRDIDAWIDELAALDEMDHKTAHRRKWRKQYSAAYYEAHREEIAAKQAAYREAHREAIRAHAREYMRERRRKEHLPEPPKEET